MAERTYTQVIFSVEGIQAYLFATGKLKEMIGGSEITASYPDKVTSICEEELSLTEADEPKDGQDWYCILQNAAGSVRLLVPNDGLAREILRRVSLLAIEKYPGLPLYGASVPCVWTTQEADSFAETFNIYDAPNPNAVDAANEQSFAQAFQSGQEKIAQKRAIQAMPPRSVWPFCRVAPLDGLPAVWKDKDQYVSAESRARSTQDLLNDAEKRFKEVEDYLRTGEDAVLPPKTEFVWFRDLDTMLEQSPLKKIALLHMDGNSLGALFRRRRAELKGKPVAEQNRAMRALSLLVDRANKHAFTCALRAIIAQEIKESGLCPAYYPVPARPLVLGGDDLTILIKANLAFDFADAYAAAFEAYTKEQNTPMSVGGGMVIIPKGYPFTRAFGMVEALTDNAKAMTETEDEGTFRPSSIDYLVLTNDIDRDIFAMRKKSQTARDGSLLTGKPFYCGQKRSIYTDIREQSTNTNLADILADIDILRSFPASQLRSAIDACREGQAEGKRVWTKLKENLKRDLGNGTKLLASFERLFPTGFFHEKNGQMQTLLGDYLELRRIFSPLER